MPTRIIVRPLKPKRTKKPKPAQPVAMASAIVIAKSPKETARIPRGSGRDAD